MKHQKLLSYVRRAVDDYQMIQEGDKIAVGVSGGKDSLCLLLALASLKRFYPKSFELEAIAVSLGFADVQYTAVKELCDAHQIPFTVVATDIGEIIFTRRQEKNPCSLCSKMRKGALHDMAVAKGCNRVALGHNKDDMLETFFMSLFFEGRLHTFAPVSYLDRSQLYSIRPLLYVSEQETRSYASKYCLPIVKNPCPADGNTKRQEIKELIHKLSAEYDNLDGKVFSALIHSSLKGFQKEGIDNGSKQLP